MGISAWPAAFSHSDLSSDVSSSERPFLTTLPKLAFSITLYPPPLLHFSSQYLIPADYISYICLLSLLSNVCRLRIGTQGQSVLLTTVSLEPKAVPATTGGT